MPRIMQPVALQVSVILTVDDAAGAIEFYKHAFAALERVRKHYPHSDAIEYAELAMGESQVILRDDAPHGLPQHQIECKSPSRLGGSSIMMLAYFDDPDAAFESAVAAGAEVVERMSEADLETRYGVVRDPYGYLWMCASQPRGNAREEHWKWPRIDIG
jgi:PhnB protein